MSKTRLDELKKNNHENWTRSSGITTTDYMDRLIEQVWQEAYLQGRAQAKYDIATNPNHSDRDGGLK
jgi:hypothetical protein